MKGVVYSLLSKHLPHLPLQNGMYSHCAEMIDLSFTGTCEKNKCKFYRKKFITLLSFIMVNTTEFQGYFIYICSFQKWRPYINRFEKKIEDFNFGTLLRIDCTKDYTEENSILGKWFIFLFY